MFMFKKLTPLLLVALISLGVMTASASAAEGPVWKVLAVSNPTNFMPGDQTGSDAIVVTATNVGGAATGCTAEQLAAEPRPVWSPIRQCPKGSPVASPVTISDSLPKGLDAVQVFGENAYQGPRSDVIHESDGPPYGLSCALSPAPHCTTSEPVDPGDTLVVTIRVKVQSDIEGFSEINSASVSGGGAAGASVDDAVTISETPAEYGVAASFAATSTGHADAHPNVTTAFFLNTTNLAGEKAGRNGIKGPGLIEDEPADEPKDVGFDLPPGLVGTTVGMPRCTMAAVANESDCPRDTMVGATTLIFEDGNGRTVVTTPVFNIAPAPGEPVAFAFNVVAFNVRLDTSVLSDGDYGVRVTAPDITAGAGTYASFVTIWGVPADHNGPGPDAAAKNLAGGFFLFPEVSSPPQISFGGPGVEAYESDNGDYEQVNRTRVPLLSNPSQCSSAQKAMLETDSWEGLGPGVFAKEATAMGTATGCGQLSFEPKISMLPDTLEAGAPAGYSFDLNLPQNTEPEGLATPDVKRTSVTLPLGTVISPSAADGLGVCSSEQFYGPAAERGLERPATPGSCPRDSQVGTIRVKTPALEERLHGDVYLGTPECTGANGVCTPEDAAEGRMVHLYAQFVSEGEDGIVVKLEGKGRINQQTGQITTVFENTPELPFSELELTLQGGERATLANPRTCGEVRTTADLTPWSSPFTPDASPESNFDVDENCFGPQFDPSFSAGTTSNQAGGYSPFTLAFGRGDDDEFLNGVQLHMPPGLLGAISKVKLCGEPQAAQGTCPAESQIGEVTVETGPGADPFLVKGGKVYVTGAYKGAPFGLSIVVPAKAGPYTLAGTTGNGTVVNRSAISVNPETSALTVTSDPLPTELDGIPLQLRLVNVTVGTNTNFTFNPTNCDKLQIGGTLTSTEATSASESSSFQVTNCGSLAFKPDFSVSTSGKTSRLNGASLDARLTYPNTGQGTEANIARVKVELPKQLPSRLPTLQKACTAAVFEANPANCPAESVVGVVKASIPILTSSLSGPVYFVSHGGEAFPSLIMVLQGEGVRVDLVGSTFISKAGVTSTTLKTVPDVPVSSFELYLPEGPYSALTTDGVLCNSSPRMPTTFTAQDGTEIHESVKIAVTGCAKAKTVKKKTKAKASRARKSSHGRGRQS
jgi:hypothetical protein